MRPTQAMESLREQARGEFSEYPVSNAIVRRMFGRTALWGKNRRQKARKEAEDFVGQGNRIYEDFADEFLATLAKLYPHPGFANLGLMFSNTNNPNATNLYVEEDDSYGVGLDYGMMFIFSYTFGALLYSRINNYDNRAWLRILFDIFTRQFSGYDRKAQTRLDAQDGLRRMHPSLTLASNLALTMAFQFVIAHEVGHMYLDHFKTKRTTNVSGVGTGSEGEKIIDFSHDQEYDADAWAAATLLRVAGPSPLEQTLARHIPALFLGVLSLVNMLHVPLTPLAKDLQNSHPGAWNRALKLKPTSTVVSHSDKLITAICDLHNLIEMEHCGPLFPVLAFDLKVRAKAAANKRPWWRIWQ